MSEFPSNPTKRELERQQAIATVISGIAYQALDACINPDFVPEEPVILERTAEAQRGFNYDTYVEYVQEGTDG